MNAQIVKTEKVSNTVSVSHNTELGAFWATTSCGYTTGIYFKKELAVNDAERFLIWQRNYLRQNPSAKL